MGDGLMTRLNRFFTAPLGSSPRDLILIVGIVIVLAVLWTRVLRVLVEAANLEL